MKEIKAFIRPHMLDTVVDALEGLPHIPGLTVSEVRGWGHVKGAAVTRLTERMKLEMVVPDDRVEEVVSLLYRTASTGHPGDGGIFVSAVERSVRIGENHGA
ncbi:MAG: P-II family nitrogen regulator [Gemmatimonadota bacterium]|nr:P-II family nitrogen regulator [Gemmatimonadota bacterium]